MLKLDFKIGRMFGFKKEFQIANFRKELINLA